MKEMIIKRLISFAFGLGCGLAIWSGMTKENAARVYNLTMSGAFIIMFVAITIDDELRFKKKDRE